MPITLNDFLLKANTTRFDSRDIVVNDINNAQRVKHGNLIFSTGQKLNDATMKAFKAALQQQYGVFGLHAFDTVVGTRAQLHKSLRACDIKAVVSQMETLKQKRFTNELERQMTNSPHFLELHNLVRTAVKDIVRQEMTKHTVALTQCQTHDDIAKLANQTLLIAIQKAKMDPDVGNVADIGISQLQHGEEQPMDGVPMGLSRIHGTKATYGKRATSVEDHVKKGTIGAGMRVNLSKSSRPVIFEALKTNGVEPGFIYHNDWSLKDTRALLINTHSQKTMNSINNFIAKSPKLTTQAQGKTYLEKGLLVGRAHPASVAFAAEYVLSKELDKLGQNPQLDSPLIKSIKLHFGDNVQKTDFFPADGSMPSPQQRANLEKLKKDCFVQIRDAVMTYGKTQKEIDPNAKLPVFTHFTDRHILKLDYNENDRTSIKDAPSSAQFRLPERVSIKGGTIKGHFYRKYRLTTADKASVGAVSEALANDLTRLLGVPAQDLTLVRGQYSDGHPKIMLESKFAEGYKDLDGIYIEDGHIKAEVNAAPLGKFKAIFLALADRDAVGSHGQNKGFIGNPNDPNQIKTFFAIDPGHSLEGNGKDLEIHDNLSFIDRGGGVLQKRFLNYSIFDDDTRFHKLEGVLKLRELRDSGAITKLFLDYGKAFNPQEQGISEAEKSIREEIITNLTAMQNEFIAQIDKIPTACADQLKLYDDLAGNPDLQKNAIETIENLEKLTSKTTWKSEHGKVELKHLSVIEETRIPWTAKKVGNTLVYTSRKPIPQDRQFHLNMLNTLIPQSQLEFDPEGKASFTVPIGHQSDLFFDIFDETKAIQLTHLEEAADRENRA